MTTKRFKPGTFCRCNDLTHLWRFLDNITEPCAFNECEQRKVSFKNQIFSRKTHYVESLYSFSLLENDIKCVLSRVYKYKPRFKKPYIFLMVVNLFFLSNERTTLLAVASQLVYKVMNIFFFPNRHWLDYHIVIILYVSSGR